jgi:glycosyltransferase involved in cell wall biosynthesis
MGEPLISITMPCFNAEQTLPMALASLQAQTHENWEAIVVDDGSTDRTWELLRSFDDPRLRLHRFPENRGRGAARAQCLEMVRGEFLSFLDSDDWLFPGKLALQASFMREEPRIVVLSGACVITDGNDEAVGFTATGAEPGQPLSIGRFERPQPPPLSFPPCMIRMDQARHARFNPKFRRSQDSDFLIQVMLGKYYGVSPVPVYAYSQAEAANLQKTVEGYQYRIRCYRQYLRRYPLDVGFQISKTLARMAVYSAAGLLGQEDRLIQRRWQDISPEAKHSFQEAKNAVAQAAAKLSIREN